jgi:hypothetical protein
LANSQVTTRDTKLEKQAVGFIKLSVTNYDTTSEPQIENGSIVEVAGSLFQYTGDESATGWAGISNSTACYMRVSESGGSLSAEYTDTAPTWDGTKQGWYDATGSYRYILRLYKDSSGNYVNKDVYAGRYGERGVQYQTVVEEDTSTGLSQSYNGTISVTFDFTPTAVLDAKIVVWDTGWTESNLTDNSTYIDYEGASASLWGGTAWGYTRSGTDRHYFPAVQISKAEVGTNKVDVTVIIDNATLGNVYYRLTVTAVKTP